MAQASRLCSHLKTETMYLESFNQFFNVSLALWGLAIFTLILAALVVFALLAASGQNPSDRQAGSFTCPCYAPPYVPSNQDRDKSF